MHPHIFHSCLQYTYYEHMQPPTHCHPPSCMINIYHTLIYLTLLFCAGAYCYGHKEISPKKSLDYWLLLSERGNI